MNYGEHVTINRGLSIIIPETNEVNRIASSYYSDSLKDDFLDIRNRYVWLVKVMHKCVEDIESE